MVSTEPFTLAGKITKIVKASIRQWDKESRTHGAYLRFGCNEKNGWYLVGRAWVKVGEGTRKPF